MIGLAHSHGLLGEAAPEAEASAGVAAAAVAALRPFLHEHSDAFYHELRRATGCCMPGPQRALKPTFCTYVTRLFVVASSRC